MKDLSVTISRYANVAMVIILSLVLTGGFGVEIVDKEEPCPLCLLQRMCMLAVAIAALMNLRFGIHPAHYALFLVGSLMGGGFALRHIVLHICPGFPTYGVSVLGLSLYTWSFLVFFCVILSTGLLLFCYPPQLALAHRKDRVQELNKIEVVAFSYISLLALANLFNSFRICGFTACVE